MKKNSKKVKYRSNNNGLEEPLREIIELNIKRDETDEEKNVKEDYKKINNKNVSFCSRLFFLWTLIIMKLSNKKKIKKRNNTKKSFIYK